MLVNEVSYPWKVLVLENDLKRIVKDFPSVSSYGGSMDITELSKLVYYLWDYERGPQPGQSMVYPSKSPGGLKTLFEHYLRLKGAIKTLIFVFECN